MFSKLVLDSFGLFLLKSLEAVCLDCICVLQLELQIPVLNLTPKSISVILVGTDFQAAGADIENYIGCVCCGGLGKGVSRMDKLKCVAKPLMFVVSIQYI